MRPGEGWITPAEPCTDCKYLSRGVRCTHPQAMFGGVVEVLAVNQRRPQGACGVPGWLYEAVETTEAR